MPSTKRPATWWLNSDHARSASVRGALRSSTGISVIFGDVSAGQRGANRTPTSASEARSATTSPAGGNEVKEAATNRTVAPRPNSTSTKRRRRGSDVSAPAGRRRTAKKFAAPRRTSPPRTTTFVRIMLPYEVPRIAPVPSTYAKVSPTPATTRATTEANDIAEKRLRKAVDHPESLRD